VEVCLRLILRDYIPDCRRDLSRFEFGLMPSSPLVSVVVPVFGNGESLQALTERICVQLGDSCEVILVDDGNSLQVWNRILQLTNSQVIGIRLSRNFGQHAATLAGVRAARGAFTVTIDDDLQNIPEEIPLLTDALVESTDLVYGISKTSSHSFYRNLLSKFARVVLSTLSMNPAIKSMSSFRAFRTNLRDSFQQVSGSLVSLDVLLLWATSRVSCVETSHNARHAGESSYSTRALVRHFFRHLAALSTRLLVIATALGGAMFLLSVAGIVWVVGRRLATGVSVDGFPFLASSLLAFSGMQLVVSSALGLYIGQIHQRVINRPVYFVLESTSSRESY